MGDSVFRSTLRTRESKTSRARFYPAIIFLASTSGLEKITGSRSGQCIVQYYFSCQSCGFGRVRRAGDL